MAGKKPKRSKLEWRVGKTVGSPNLLRELAVTFKLPNLDRSQVFSRWPEIVGNRYAAVSRPERIQGDTLIVNVEDSMWGQDLRQHWTEILVRLVEVTGETGIKRLRVRTGPTDNAFRLPEPPPSLDGIEVDTADIDRALDATALRDRPELRERMRQAWITGRRKRKLREETES
jgi:hypothetical protein